MAGKSKISMKQVADRLHLSQGTVSVVLNGRGDEMRISAETQKLILDAAKEMGYPMERLRNRRKTAGQNGEPVVVLFIPYLDEGLNPYNRIIRGLHNEMEASGVHVNILVRPFEYGQLSKSYRYLSEDFCSGAIIFALAEPDLQELLKQDVKVPVVIFNHVNEKYPSVYVDDYNAGYRVAELFKARGHKKVGMIMSYNRNKATGLRAMGYMDGCRYLGLELQEEHTQECLLSKKGGELAARRLLDSQSLPEAVFTTVDDIALGALEELKKHHIRIPEQMELMSYGDNEWDAILSPALSSIRLPVEEMTATCLHMLNNMMTTGDWSPISRIYSLEFVIRESCGGYPGEADR